MVAAPRFFSVGVIRWMFTLLMRCCERGMFPLESVCCVMFAVLGNSYMAELLPSLSARGYVAMTSRSGVNLLLSTSFENLTSDTSLSLTASASVSSVPLRGDGELSSGYYCRSITVRFLPNCLLERLLFEISIYSSASEFSDCTFIFSFWDVASYFLLFSLY